MEKKYVQEKGHLLPQVHYLILLYFIYLILFLSGRMGCWVHADETDSLSLDIEIKKKSLNPNCHGPLGPVRFMGGGFKVPGLLKTLKTSLNHHLTMKFCIYPQDVFRTRL